MRMDIVAQTNVPMIVCQMVCFLRITLEIAIRGVNMNINGRKFTSGKRKRSVKKNRVE